MRNIIDKWRSGNTGKDDYLFNILKKNDDLEEQKRKVAAFIKNTNKYSSHLSTTAQYFITIPGKTLNEDIAENGKIVRTNLLPQQQAF